MALKSVTSYCSRVAQTATDFADASHSKSAKSATTTVSYGIFSSENAYPCTVMVANPFKKSDNTHRAVWAQRTQNLLAKSGAERFREYIRSTQEDVLYGLYDHFSRKKRIL